MNEWRSEETLVRYYCTAGCGMERFLIDEVKHKLAAEDVCQIAGKVLFSSSAEISRVCQLKAAERLFLLLKQDSPVCLTAYTSPGISMAYMLNILIDQTVLEPSRIKPEPPLVPVSFRISCKCTGSLSRYFSTQELSRIIGVGLSQLLGWKPDLKNPQLEASSFDKHYQIMGFLSPFLRLPLANRCYTKTTGLRSTVAWAMASLAQIQPGFCVVDPMCGVGTILIEAAQEHTAARFLGVDIDDGQLQKATENIEFAELGNRVHLLKASSMMLPLPSASVDAVVCDLPFGRKFGTKTNMADNLPHILSEIDRVLCVGGTLVLLLSPQLSCLLKKLLAQRDAETTSNKELKPLPCVQECPSLSSASTRRQTLQIPQGINLPPTQETGPQSGLQHSLSLLKHQATFRVSLGMIDGLIHKYVKIHT
uniref:Ribosomal RNA large subunit methyltransferase K/L-like methyltransferase domain-containing protein n=1 Tax=Mola mola TaxID=94237 RepID=A0A3Q3W0P0_MOLML